MLKKISGHTKMGMSAGSLSLVIKTMYIILLPTPHRPDKIKSVLVKMIKSKGWKDTIQSTKKLVYLNVLQNRYRF